MNDEPDAGKSVASAGQHAHDKEEMPAFKKQYLESSCSVCTFCGSQELESGPLEADGMAAWSTVECPGCQHTWQDVWTLVDMTEVRDKNGHEVLP